MSLHSFTPRGATQVADLLEERRALVLCNACATFRMPGNWLARKGYYYMSGCRAVGVCDYCKERGNCGLFVREEGAMAEQAIRRERLVGRYKKGDPNVVMI